MHCVYHATRALLLNNAQPREPFTFARYAFAKLLAGCNVHEYTYGGVVPFVVQAMVWPRRIVMQHRLVQKEHYVAQAPNAVVRLVCKLTDYGEHVNTLGLHNAVYLSLSRHHAEYRRKPPEGQSGYIMAIGLTE